MTAFAVISWSFFALPILSDICLVGTPLTDLLSTIYAYSSVFSGNMSGVSERLGSSGPTDLNYRLGVPSS